MTAPTPGTAPLAACWLEATRVLARPAVLVALVPVILAKGLALAALATFPHPPWGAALEGLFRAVGGEAALRYPDAWAHVPRVAARIAPALDVLAGSMSAAALVALVPDVLRGRRPALGAALVRGVSVLPAVALLALPAAVIDVVGALLRDRAGDLPGAGAAALALLGLAVAVRSALAWAVPALVLGRSGPVRAIARSLGLAALRPVAALTFGAIPVFAALPFAPGPAQVAVRFGRVPPEAVFLFLAGGVVLTALASGLALVAATRHALTSLGREG